MMIMMALANINNNNTYVGYLKYNDNKSWGTGVGVGLTTVGWHMLK